MMPLRPSKIIGIGRNYVEHARELGNEVPDVPIMFFKPPTALSAPVKPSCCPASPNGWSSRPRSASSSASGSGTRIRTGPSERSVDTSA